MRKHFLILMLMALLPLAGWAETDPVDLPSDLAVTFTHAEKYTGAAIPVAINTARGTVGELANQDVKENVEIEKFFADQACTNEILPENLINAGTYYVRVHGKGGVYKTTSHKDFPITIAKFGNITVTAKALPKIYGAAYPTTGYYTAVMPDLAPEVDADGEHNPKANVGLVVTPSFKDDAVNWPINKPAGVHGFTISVNTVANYNIVVVEENANLTINKVNLTVKATDKTMDYGTAKPDYGVTYGPTLVDGDEDSWTPTFTEDENTVHKNFIDNKGAVGTYTITPGGLTSDNYNFVYETGTLTVNKRAISNVTFEMAGATYDRSNQVNALKAFKTLTDATIVAPAVAPTADDFTVAIYNVETEGTPLDGTTEDITQAGTYYAAISSAEGNYKNAAAARIPVVLAQKTLNIISKDRTEDYSGATPGLTSADVEFNGLISGDNDGTLPAKGAYAATYGSAGDAFAAEFALGLSTAGAKNAGTYTINTSSKLSKAKAEIFNNYKVNFVNTGVMTINKIQVTLKPKNLTIQYGDEEPDWANVGADAFEIAFSKKSNGDAVSLTDDFDPDETLADVFTTLPVIERAIPSGKSQGDVGTYVLTATGYTLKNPGNYELKAGEPKTGTLTIEAATSITVLVDNVEVVYGQYATVDALKAANKLTYRISGVKNEDKEFVNVTLNVVKHDNPTKPYDGTRVAYDIKATSVTLGDEIKDNYAGVEITTLDGALTVNKAPLKIEALTQSLRNSATIKAASSETVKISEETPLAQASDLADLFHETHGIKLMFDTHVERTTPTTLDDDANEHGWDGTNDSGNGIYVGGIVIDASVYEGNYFLTGEGAETKAGLLTVTDGTIVAFDVTAETTGQIEAQVNKLINAQISLNASKKKLTLYGDEWNAMILPFDIDPLAFCNAIEGYAIFDVLEESGSAMNFKITYETIPAYTPFLVKVKNDVKMYEKTFDNVIVKAIPEEAEDIASANDSYFFQGNLAKCTPEGWVITSNSAADPTVKPGSITLWNNVGKPAAEKYACKAFSAYIKAKSATTEAPVLYIEEADGSTTAISAITADGVAVKAEGWYTINGIRLQGAPTEKGIYINNGKKIVIK